MAPVDLSDPFVQVQKPPSWNVLYKLEIHSDRQLRTQYQGDSLDQLAHVVKPLNELQQLPPRIAQLPSINLLVASERTKSRTGAKSELQRNKIERNQMNEMNDKGY